MSNRGFLAVLASIAFVGLLGFGLIAKGGERIAVGEPAPDAPVERLDGSGATSLADYRGQWVLVNFWASWCKPCEEEPPAIERYADEHRDELVVVGINTEVDPDGNLALIYRGPIDDAFLEQNVTPQITGTAA